MNENFQGNKDKNKKLQPNKKKKTQSQKALNVIDRNTSAEYHLDPLVLMVTPFL